LPLNSYIKGAGSDTLTIEGVRELQPFEHTVMPDRIEAGTFLIAGAMTRGDVRVRGLRSAHQEALIVKLREAGVEISGAGDELRVKGPRRITPVDIQDLSLSGFSDGHAGSIHGAHGPVRRCQRHQ
jgi:UDP-N-acetylglucosamine 1-carboxyvinyltransferase